jgi:hypothetical protein
MCRESAGGPNISTNSVEEVVPPLFKKNGTENCPIGPYSLSEREFIHMARQHYASQHWPLSEFSSWSASLHLVLCYARNLTCKERTHVLVAIIDTNLLNNVFVWHFPHLGIRGGRAAGRHEYLAHGPIRGEGYKAVRYRDLMEEGLKLLFPEHTRITQAHYAKEWEHMFRFQLREDMFTKVAACTFHKMEAHLAARLAALFPGQFAVVFCAALISLRKREWIGSEPDFKDMLRLGQALGKFFPPTPRAFPNENEAWLQPGMVDTAHFPDVKQWIDFVRAVVRCNARLGKTTTSLKTKNYAVQKKELCTRLTRSKSEAAGGDTNGRTSNRSVSMSAPK